MEKLTQEIDANGFRYLSQIPEFKEGLPFGILNKVITDVGGTFAALNCDCNYIVVTPTIDLVQSIKADKNVKHKVFGVYGGVSYASFRDYLFDNTIHKIAVTYDSLPKVAQWLDKNNFESSKYKLLIDEYHLLLEDMDYRAEAILKLMEKIKHFEHYTFMSATPINDIFLPKSLEKLPYTTIKWNKVTSFKPSRQPCRNVYQFMVKLIKNFQEGMIVPYNEKGDEVKVEQLFIFLNSVKGIKKIIDSAELTEDDVKVVCSDNLRNAEQLGDISISKVTDPNAPINFFTKKGFQGCNLFSNNGLVIVVSDGQKKHTLVDISTTLHQIAGRLRENEEFSNILRDQIWHIFSTSTSLFRTEEVFNKYMKDMTEQTDELIKMYNEGTPPQKALIRQIDTEDKFCYYDPRKDEYVRSEDKEGSMRYKHHLVNHIYKNGVMIRNAYDDAGLDGYEYDTYWDDNETLKELSTKGFRARLEQYVKLREEGTNDLMILKYEMEQPLFKQAYDQLGKSGIVTCKWVEGKIKEMVRITAPETMLAITVEFLQRLKAKKPVKARITVGEMKSQKSDTGIFVTNTEAKGILAEIYNDYHIKGITPRLKNLEDAKGFTVEKSQKRIDGKQVWGLVVTEVIQSLFSDKPKKKN